MSPGGPGEQTEGLIAGILQSDEQSSAVAGEHAELLTFLVADIRGYTRFTQQHGDEAAAKLTARFANVVRDLIANFGGTVFELRGDEALCIFSSPRQCLRVAVALQQRFVEETAADSDVPMGIGIGIDVGEAVRSPDGFRGGALNLAARLCGQARAGEVLATPEVTHLAGRIDGVHYDTLDRVVLKGMSERVRPVRVVPDGEDPARQIAALLASATAPTPPRGMAWLPQPLASRPRATLATLLAGLAAIGTVVGFTATRGSGPTTVRLHESSVGILDPATGNVLDQIDVPNGPEALAAGYGSMWTADTDTNTVTRIDLASRRVVHTIDVGVAPSAIAVGMGSVWVVNTTSGTVSRIDPETNQAYTVQVGASPRGVVVAHGYVWVTNSGDGTVSRIDPAQNAEVDAIPVGFGPSGIAAGHDIWVANSGSDAVTEFDPATPHQTQTFGVGTSPKGVTVIGDGVWVTNNLGATVTRILIGGTSDPETSGAGERPNQVALVDGHIWLAGQATGVVAELDPRSGQVRHTVPIGPIPGGIAAGDGKLWVTTTIDPARHRGGTLKLVGDPITSVDPIWGPVPHGDPNLGGMWLIWNGSYDGLVAFAHTTGADSTAVVPDLATAIPKPSPDGRTYTFTLRSGIHWSTGQLVTVSDVRRGIERLLASRVNLQFRGQIVGARRCLPRACSVSGVSVDQNARTISITLKHPNGNFVDELAGAFAFAVPASTPLTEDDTHPIPATGPYRIARFVAGDTLILDRNPYFHEWSPTAQPAGFPDTIVWRSDTGQGAVDDVAANRADWADAANAPSVRLGPLKAKFGDRAIATVSTSLYAVSLNTHIAPFNDPRVRRAVAFALDRYLVDLDWSKPATIACQFLPPGYSAYRPYCPYTLSAPDRGGWRAPDLSTAQRLVRQSHTEGMTVSVLLWDPSTRQAFSHVVDALNKLGYDAHLEQYQGNDYFGYVADSRHKVQAAFWGWINGDATAASLLDSWRCSAFTRGDPANHNTSGFCDPRFDKLLDEARTVEATSLAQATELWARADRILTDDAPWIPLVTPSWVDVISARVNNDERSPVLGMLFDQMRLR